MKKLAFILSICISISTIAQQPASFPTALHDHSLKNQILKKHHRYADVMQFLNTIKTMSPYIQVGSIGKSTLGKDIPYAVLANPAISSPEQAKQSGKPVVYIQGNIHGGEVEGKEVSMMLMRDILLGNLSELLSKQIIVFVPIYNTDGNDKFAKGLRPSQENSPLETGIRENGQGLDLNRDGMKMETPETKAMVANILNAWDPQMVVDLHTTNGTWHGYDLTWAPGYLSAGEPGPYHYTNSTILPYITNQVKKTMIYYLDHLEIFQQEKDGQLKIFILIITILAISLIK
jgi:murein tripeptide amidase MpaA